MSIPNEFKVVARSALNAFGGKPSVSKYWDSSNKSSIDLLSVINSPLDGVTSYSTIGLSDHSINYTVDGISLRVEIVGASTTGYEDFPNIIATCAFCIINSKYTIAHGETFHDIIKMYYPESDMKHVLFLSPFLWEDLKTLDFPNKKVAWLLAVPISDNEYMYAQEKGTDSLEELFEKEEIDILDLERESVL